MKNQESDLDASSINPADYHRCHPYRRLFRDGSETLQHIRPLPDAHSPYESCSNVVCVTEECNTGTARADILYSSVLNIHLDERDNREGGQMDLKPNGFTEPTVIKDYPIRNRKVLLHVRRRRYLDADGRNIILNRYPLTADGTKVSVEFGLFFKDSDGYSSIDGSVIGKILSY